MTFGACHVHPVMKLNYRFFAFVALGYISLLALNFARFRIVLLFGNTLFAPQCAKVRPDWLSYWIATWLKQEQRNARTRYTSLTQTRQFDTRFFVPDYVFLSMPYDSAILSSAPALAAPISKSVTCIDLYWPGDKNLWNVFSYAIRLSCFALASFPLIIVTVGFLVPHIPKRHSTPRTSDNEENIALGSSDVTLVFRVVTKGDQLNIILGALRTNAKLLFRASENDILNDIETFNQGVDWYLELVTDLEVPWHSIGILKRLENCGRLKQIVVPPGYETPKRSLYKARALHYASLNDLKNYSPEALIIHLDEETTMTLDSIRGILDYARYYPRTCIGQGMITYGSRTINNLLLTLADSNRCGCDYAIHQLLFWMGSSGAGFHGSYLVVPSRIEQKITFDHGPEASITEDAFFAIRASIENVSVASINGFMHERSAFTTLDFIKQRSRWLNGLLLVLDHFSLLEAKLLRALVMSWVLTPWLAMLVCVCGALMPSSETLLLKSLKVWILTTSQWCCLTGAWINFSGANLNPLRRLGYFFMVLVFQPIFVTLEAVGAIHGTLSRSKTFYVVDKDCYSEEESLASTERSSQFDLYDKKKTSYESVSSTRSSPPVFPASQSV
eukprot:Gregarina_sp_Poly_1__3284@NODE_1941_length_3038_cov_17_605183_g1251_i0_p1_GENE_NODE_1941_length_3038_cov_17_605183_g1251_i0NODE_1941_length_3038_cov_17_605183_g1251_i0_p1_ORF_typecomplete_len616_score47_23Glyco_trans_2_3/PF13632_6/1_8e04Glyco_trans_2_3/PF13632_6/1_2e17Chitin_synth_2/PF03142_15/0_47_NODE_1941_length_3038_cov_17_605183_g1251_i07782625